MNNLLSPLTISEAKTELTIAILGIQNKYQLPAYLMELIINNCLVDVKTCSCNEIVNSIKEDKEKEGVENG